MDYQLGPGPLQVDQNTIDEKIKGDIGIVENGDVATHAIPNGYYVIWKGDLYVAKTSISSGTTLSAESNGNLTAKPNGLGGEVAALNSNIASDWTLCTDYKSSSESDANAFLYSFGKQRTLSFQGVQRVHTEDEVIMTLPTQHRPLTVSSFGIGVIGTTPVIMRLNPTNGQLTLYLLNGATSSARLYFIMSWVVA